MQEKVTEKLLPLKAFATSSEGKCSLDDIKTHLS